MGLFITKYLSAITRTTLNVLRTSITWVISLIIGWEKFSFIQLYGFLIASFGVFWYSYIISK